MLPYDKPFSEPKPEQLQKIKDLIRKLYGIEMNDEQAHESYFSMMHLGRAMARSYLLEKERKALEDQVIKDIE